MRYLILLSFILIAGCAVKHPTPEDLQVDFNRVKKCMGISEATKIPVHIDKVNTDYVMCGDVKSKGCYNGGTITLPYRGGYNVIYHEFVHAVCDKVMGLGNDPKHECKVGGESAYLKCGGGLLID